MDAQQHLCAAKTSFKVEDCLPDIDDRAEPAASRALRTGFCAFTVRALGVMFDIRGVGHLVSDECQRVPRRTLKRVLGGWLVLLCCTCMSVISGCLPIVRRTRSHTEQRFDSPSISPRSCDRMFYFGDSNDNPKAHAPRFVRCQSIRQRPPGIGTQKSRLRGVPRA